VWVLNETLKGNRCDDVEAIECSATEQLLAIPSALSTDRSCVISVDMLKESSLNDLTSHPCNTLS